MTTCCLPYECGVWHPAARAPAAPTPRAGTCLSFSVTAALGGLVTYALLSPLRLGPRCLGVWGAAG